MQPLADRLQKSLLPFTLNRMLVLLLLGAYFLRSIPFMKKLYFLLSAIAMLFIFSGCAKKSTGPGYYIQARIGNTDYYATNCIIFSSGSATIIDGFLSNSISSTYPYMVLSLQNSLGLPGKIKLDNTTGSTARYFTSATHAMVSESGSVVITDISGNNVTGTFSFTCTDGTTVTDGAFTAKRM